MSLIRIAYLRRPFGCQPHVRAARRARPHVANCPIDRTLRLRAFVVVLRHTMYRPRFHADAAPCRALRSENTRVGRATTSKTAKHSLTIPQTPVFQNGSTAAVPFAHGLRKHGLVLSRFADSGVEHASSATTTPSRRHVICLVSTPSPQTTEHELHSPTTHLKTIHERDSSRKKT